MPVAMCCGHEVVIVTVGLSTRPMTTAPAPPRGHHLARRLLRLFALDSGHPFRDLSVGFVAGAIGVALNVGIYAVAGWYHVRSVQFDAGPLLIDGLLMMFVLKGAFEEILFRGIVFRGIERVSGTGVALVIASLGFGLMHLMNAGATLLNALGTAAAGGVMLSAAYLLTRNLWLAIGIHWAADFWQGAFFGVAPTGDTFSHPLLHSTLDGPTVWTGGAYGGGIVGLAIGCSAAAVMLAIAIRRGHFRPLRAQTARSARNPQANV